MTIEKLPSGSYRIKQMHKGKYYTVTVPYKPNKKEATMLLADRMASQGENQPVKGTLDEYIEKYISKCKKLGKSPATIRTYTSLHRNIPEWILSMQIGQIDNDDLQKLINEYGETHAAKGTRNMFTLVSSTMAEFRREFKIMVNLPYGEKKAEYEPTTDDIRRILEEVEGTRYSIPIQLYILGVRRGEICALELTDLDDKNVLTINKDVVIDENNNLITKQPKTQASVRRITLPQGLADQIREQGYIYDGYIGKINQHLGKVEERLGIPHFKLHKLRAYCTAYLHKMGFTDEQIMAWGGWSTSSVMKAAYRYNLDPAESQKKIADSIGSILG